MSSNALALQQSNIIPFPVCEAPEKQRSNEWYTPSRYIDAARKVMGSIDLDPASCEVANRTVQAKRYFAQKDNGLAQAWYGRVWLNPPFGLIHPGRKGETVSWQRFFAEKCQREYEMGNIEQAILLLLGSTVFRTYFQPFWQYPVCINHVQAKFARDDGSTSQLGYGCLFVYFGTHEQDFIREFSRFGIIAKSIAGPRHETVQARLWGAV